MELVFATGNAHKIREVQGILTALGANIQVGGYDGPSPQETGTTFLENASIKANAAFEATGKPSFADDSGLCVEVMGGAPGIFSAIWSGTRDDKTNRDLLLAQLEDIAEGHRQASFVCTIALADASGIKSFTGVWPGSIALQAAGEGGFGYDPVFVPEDFAITAAQLEPELKNQISHRALALSQMASFLSS
jgi:XTP/dITP diphosphohydrolase